MDKKLYFNLIHRVGGVALGASRDKTIPPAYCMIKASTIASNAVLRVTMLRSWRSMAIIKRDID